MFTSGNTDGSEAKCSLEPFSKCLLRTRNHRNNLTPDTPKRYVTNGKSGSDPGRLFGQRTCKVLAAARRVDVVSLSASTVLNTGTGPNTIHKRAIDYAWHSYISLVQSLKLLYALKPVMKSCRLVHLIVSTSESRARVSYLALQNLAVECLLGTPNTTHLVKAVLPGPRKAVSYRFSSVTISDQNSFVRPENYLTF